MLQLQQKELLFKQLYQISKKLVLVLATSMLVTKIYKKDIIALDWVSSICCLIWFKKKRFRSKPQSILAVKLML